MDSSDDDRPISQIVMSKLANKKDNTSVARGKHITTSSTEKSITKPISVTSNIIRTAPVVHTTPKAKISTSNHENINDKIKKEIHSSDEDDIPLVQLIRKRHLETLGPEAKPDTKKVKKESTSKKNSKSKQSNDKNTKIRKKLNQIYDKSSIYYDSDKGRVVQALLIRWWYAIDWPQNNHILGEAPDGYENLDGFPGVYVGTRMDNLGNIIDLRDKNTCPNFRNMWKKSTEELKTLCTQAIRGQINALREHEGPDTKLERDLVRELQQISSINASTADRKAPK
jgi:hypothetical protein